MLTWKRERVRNFSEDWADAYIATLVRLDGEPYEQPRFFEELSKTGIVKDVEDQGTPTATDALRFKRWDAYSNRIREYGLGFWEQRYGGPKIWRVSPVARAFDNGTLTYREFMALQLMRTQVPVPVMPLSGTAASQIAQGLHIRPLAVTLKALIELGQQGVGAFLSETEFSQLQRVEDVNTDLPTVLQDIVNGRAGSTSSSWVDRIASVDIWFNELHWTGYLRKVVAEGSGLPGPVIVPRWARLTEALTLDSQIPLQTYTDLPGVNRFHDFFGAAPDEQAIAILREPPEVVLVDVPKDAAWQAGSRLLTGPFHELGGLASDDEVVLGGTGLSPQDASILYRVIDGVERTSTTDVELPLEAVQRTMDGKPIQV